MEVFVVKNLFVKSLVLIITVVFTVVSFSSCAPMIYGFSFGYGLGNGFSDDGNSDIDDGNNNFVPAPDFEYGQGITIDKNPGLPDYWDDVTSTGQTYGEVSQVYYSVADSVVEISVQIETFGSFFVSEAAGSGVIITDSGLIVTNHHVIADATIINVRLTDGSEYAATLVGSDRNSDLAVLKIDPAGHKLTVARLGCSDDLVIGEDVIAIGNSLGTLGGTLSTGIISAKDRLVNVNGVDMVLLQTNAAINPGNSGGGLFNMNGELVGIVNAKMTGEEVEGLGFAIPIDYAHGIIEDLINYGYVIGD